MAQLSDEAIDVFLQRTRQGVLLSTNADGTPSGVPVWFDWNGETVRIFSSASSRKVDRIRRDPRISVLVTNDIDEPPSWVRFDGRAELAWDEDAKGLAVDVLAPRYWDLDDPGYAEVVEQWRGAPEDALVVIRLRPSRIRSSDE